MIDPIEFHNLLQKVDVRVFGFLLGNSANWPLMQTIAETSGGFYDAISNLERLWALAAVERIQSLEMIGRMPASEAEIAVRDPGLTYQIVTDHTSMVVLSDSVFADKGAVPSRWSFQPLQPQNLSCEEENHKPSICAGFRFPG